MSVRDEGHDRRTSVMAAAAARAHATMLRRNLMSIRQVGRPSVRSREVAWVVIEALDAAFEGRPLTHKLLSAMAHGVIGAATVTRAVDRAVQRGLVRRLPHAGDARRTLLIPTEAAIAFLDGRAEAAYAEIRDVVLAAERELAALAP